MTDAAGPDAKAFLSQMIRRHQLQAEPVVALLGPRGAGKSTTLAALSRECGGTVLHALLDLGAHDLDPIQAAAWISFELMRTWACTRHDPTFHRFAIGLLARNEPLSASRPLARRQIHDLIRQYVRNTPQGQNATKVARVADTSLDVAVKALGHLSGPPQTAAVLAGVRDGAKPVIGSMLQRAARLAIRDALSYYQGIPEAESAHTYDSLIKLSRATPAEAVKILLAALLADMAQNAIKHPAMRASCQCVTPDGQPPERGHAHAWVLLVDGAQTQAGRRFLAELAAVRCSRAKARQFDPLLVVASCGQWDISWHLRWCEPWRSSPPEGSRQQRIPLFSRATYELWAADNAGDVSEGKTAACWYPVWLDPLGREQTSVLAPGAPKRPGPQSQPEPRLPAHRLTGGHPGAVLALQAQLAAAVPGPVAAGQPAVPAGSVLVTPAGGQPPLWQDWALGGLPPSLLASAAQWPAIPRTAAAAAYLADGQTAADEELPGDIPDLADILDLLRQQLWISTFAAQPSRIWAVAAGDADPCAVLHPWLARCLLAAASTSPPIRDQKGSPVPGPPPGPAWAHLFSMLASAFTTPREGQDAGARARQADRALFYELALREGLPRGEEPTPWEDQALRRGLLPGGELAPRGFPAVVAALARSFNSEDHRTWIGRLDYITSAPSSLPVRESTDVTYARLLEGQDGTAIEVATAKLVALLWLYQDPLTEHSSGWDHEIYDSFGRLLRNSRRVDTSALNEAAACFAPPAAAPASR
jgi:hypothetical protein